jgi:KDO2-lipid IV(A) lauroyltransferase
MNVLKSIKMGLWLVRNIPAPLLRPLPYCFGMLSYIVGGDSRRTVIANQRQILGTTSSLRLHWQALRVMINLMHSYHLLVRLPTMTDEEIRQTVIFQGGEVLDKELEQGRGAIILGAHIAGFNILAPFAALRNQPAGAFVEPVRPPELFEFVSQIRARTGMRLFLADREGAAGALRLLRQNGVLLIAADRYLGSNGARVSFFGRQAELSHGPIVLAQRHGTPILPTTLHRLKDGQFLVRLHPPLPLADTGNRRADLEANVRLMAGALERTIAGSAEQWLIFEPMWEPQRAEEAAQPSLAQRARRVGGLGRWFANATLLLLLARPFRRRRGAQRHDR